MTAPSFGPVRGFVVPGLPQPLLVPEQNEGWMRIRKAFEAAKEELHSCNADLILVYSTMWPSVVGHQIQANPEPEWVHVDELFHDLGSIPYRFPVDAEFAGAYCDAARARGLESRTVAYHGFPVDTGSVVALKLLNPDNALPACIVSSNMYADRAETIVLGKAARDALEQQGKRAAVVVVTSLSNRLFTDFIDPKEDRIHSRKDDEWNRKVLEFLGAGRLEDVAQLSREIHRQTRVKKVVNFKPMWWMASVMGQHNRYRGHVYDYAPIYGAGAAVVSLTPSEGGVGDKEFDEEDVEQYGGDRTVLNVEGDGGQGGSPASSSPSASPSTRDALGQEDGTTVNAGGDPKTQGAASHARRVGGLLHLAGIGPCLAGADAVPGGAIRDEQGVPQEYDVTAQTEAAIGNLRTMLEAAGSSLDAVVDVTAFLVDMDRDFAAYNEVYRKHFDNIQATRTTLSVSALPAPVAVEFKVIARAPGT